MKHTANMIYKPTEESRELYLVATNDSRLYSAMIIPAIANLKRKYNKGIFDETKAADLFYYIATAASNQYKRDFGYAFDVTARYTAAVDMVACYMEDIES